MRRYETIFITPPELPEEDQTALQEKVKTIMADWKGEVLKIEDWGPRKLSYQIRKNGRGRYFLVDFFAETPALVRELERMLRLNDGVLKFLTVKTADQVGMEQVQALKEAAEAAQTVSAEEPPAPAEAPPGPEEPVKSEEGGEKK